MKTILSIGLFAYTVWIFANAAPVLKLDTLLQLKLGKSKKQEVTAAFGKPKEITNLKDLPGSKETGELWEYFNNDIVRLSLSFDTKGDALQGWAWSVLEGDIEQNLKSALGRFPEATWEVETVRWVNPHHLPNECYFKDKKLGISVEYNKTRKEVSSISRWNPSRSPSSASDEKPPKFCIGEHCTKAISGKEWLEKWKVPLCEVPK